MSLSQTYQAPPGKAFPLTLQRGRGTIVDQLIVIAWLLAIPMEFPMAAPLRIPVALLVLVAAVIHYRDVLPLVKQGALFFILPGLCFVSLLWSDAPLLTLRFSVFLILTLIICAFTAARLDHRQFVTAVLISGSILCLASLAFMRTAFVGGVDGGYAVIGVFPQKNVLGMRMLVLIIAALCVLMDHRYEKLWRALALAMLAPAMFLLLQSQSATSLILVIAVGFMVLTLGGIWRPAARIRGLRPALVALAVMAFGAGSLYVVNVERINPYMEVLDRLGKDTSLTGRTTIWAVGNEVIAERPVLGVGAGAFWRAGVNEATWLARAFHIENNEFYFHSAYYEATVALGFVGLVVFLITLGVLYWTVIKDWLIRQRQLDPFFIGIAAILFIRTFVESELFSVLLMNPMILWVGVFLAVRRQLYGTD